MPVWCLAWNVLYTQGTCASSHAPYKTVTYASTENVLKRPIKEEQLLASAVGVEYIE
jgi:lambda repressor-like predicted transcriptional regulator